MLRAMGAPGSSVAVAVLLASGLLQLVNADTGSNSTQPYSCDALARVPLAERCSFVKEHCPSGVACCVLLVFPVYWCDWLRIP